MSLTFTVGINWPKRTDDTEIINIMKKTVVHRLKALNPTVRDNLIVHLEPYDVTVYGKDTNAVKEATKLLKKKTHSTSRLAR